jgi:hypothetical protein
MVAAGLALVLSGCRTAAAPPPLPEGPGGPLLVLAATDAGVWVQLLRASGASARVGTLDEMLERRAGVITPGAELVAGHTEAVRRWVARGGRAVSAHAGVLRAVGFSRPAEVTVDRASMDGLDARWPQPDTVRPLAAGGSLVDFRAHASGAGATLVASARLGRGAVLAVAMDPIKRGEAGYERLPSLGRLMASWTEAPPGPARTAAEIYVDPTTFPGTATELAARLAGAGTVHVAGWHLDAHPYEALIDALHAQGVLAYAWLDGPAVGGTLWDDHPECREQTAAGRDAQAGGRKLVALEEPACMDLAWKTWERLVTSYPWDGVNVSGLHPTTRRRWPGSAATRGSTPSASAGSAPSWWPSSTRRSSGGSTACLVRPGWASPSPRWPATVAPGRPRRRASAPTRPGWPAWRRPRVPPCTSSSPPPAGQRGRSASTGWRPPSPP